MKKTRNQKPEYWREYYKANRSKRLANAERSRLRLKYGTTEEEINQMYIDQNYQCAICKKVVTETKINKRGKPVRQLQIDHCHKTGKLRELLCKKCNMGLGSFDDDKERLYNAIAYLNKHTNIIT